MFEIIAAAPGPPSDIVVQRAEIPTDPASLFIYFLLLVAFWVIWHGHRTSGRVEDPPGSSTDPEDSGPSGTNRKSKRKGRARKERRRKRQNPDRIDWIG